MALMKNSCLGAMAVTTILAAGCTDTSPTTTTVPRDIPAPASADGVSSDSAVLPADVQKSAEQVQLEIRSWDELQAWVVSHRGKVVVVVDVWSTFCEPCIEEFPHFVALHKRLKGQVACASISIDYYGAGDTPEDIRTRVLEFLETHKATSANFISSTADEEVLDTIGVAAIPAVLVYDRSGELKKTFTNDNEEYGPTGFSYVTDVNPFVQQLLLSPE
jgi:thiol-disulfide isomerase/thioredoxin